jgi:hypothetical protein
LEKCGWGGFGRGLFIKERWRGLVVEGEPDFLAGAAVDHACLSLDFEQPKTDRDLSLPPADTPSAADTAVEAETNISD